MNPSASASREPVRRDAQVILIVGIAHATSHFFHLLLVPLFPWLRQAFGLSYAELGLLMSIFFVVSGTGQALAGFVVDRVGGWRVLLVGLGLLALAAFGLAMSRNYAMLALFAAVAGLGNSVFHPADFTLMNRRVSAPRMAHAFSMHGVLGTLGWACAPVFLAGVATLAGWRAALVAAGVGALAVLALVYFARGLLDAAPVQSEPVRPGVQAHALAFLRLPGVWMCFAFFFITSLSLGGIQSFASSALSDLYGLPIALALSAISVYMVSQGAGMIVGGFLAARTIHHERIIAIAFALAGMICVLIGSGEVPGALTLALLGLVGFGAGIAGPARDLLVRAASPRGATGRVYGVVYSGLDVGMSLAPLMFGAMMDSRHPGWVFVAIGLFQALALFTALGLGGATQRTRAQPA
ncbi:MAG: MFS transporter [Burkholderiales bacterium]|nr:MFS transporter [Burkholderiales bacterium]